MTRRRRQAQMTRCLVSRNGAKPPIPQVFLYFIPNRRRLCPTLGGYCPRHHIKSENSNHTLSRYGSPSNSLAPVRLQAPFGGEQITHASQSASCDSIAIVGGLNHRTMHNKVCGYVTLPPTPHPPTHHHPPSFPPPLLPRSPTWPIDLTETRMSFAMGHSHLFHTFGAKPPISHVFLNFIPNRRRLCPALGGD